MTRVYEVVGMAVISVGGGKGGEEDAGRGMRQGQMSLQSTEQMLGWLLVLLAYVGIYKARLQFDKVYEGSGTNSLTMLYVLGRTKISTETWLQ